MTFESGKIVVRRIDDNPFYAAGSGFIFSSIGLAHSLSRKGVLTIIVIVIAPTISNAP